MPRLPVRGQHLTGTGRIVSQTADATLSATTSVAGERQAWWLANRDLLAVTRHGKTTVNNNTSTSATSTSAIRARTGVGGQQSPQRGVASVLLDQRADHDQPFEPDAVFGITRRQRHQPFVGTAFGCSGTASRPRHRWAR